MVIIFLLSLSVTIITSTFTTTITFIIINIIIAIVTLIIIIDNFKEFKKQKERFSYLAQPNDTRSLTISEKKDNLLFIMNASDKLNTGRRVSSTKFSHRKSYKGGCNPIS